MAENSKIEWTDHTFNPWVGCTKVSPACDHCYAESWAKRTGSPGLWAGERRRTSESNWRKPLKWNRDAEGAERRPRVFCASLADVFDNAVPLAWRTDLFRLIYDTPLLDWLLLTKRIGNVSRALEVMGDDELPPNVWLGATVVNQEEADRDVPKLLAVPAAVRFLSMEPLLGPVDLRQAHMASVRLPRVDWVIVGGESGPGARPMHPEWARSLREQCAATRVAFHFKQWGEWRPINQGGPDWYADLYRSNRTAREGEDQAALDECWGTRCTVERAVIHRDGSVHGITDAGAFQQGTEPMTTYRVGKKRAGRELDGRTWDELPATDC